MDTEMSEEPGVLSEVNRQSAVLHHQHKLAANAGGDDMMSMADAAEAARRDRIVIFTHL